MCTNGAYRCVSGNLDHCVDGQWESHDCDFLCIDAGWDYSTSCGYSSPKGHDTCFCAKL